MITVVSGLPRSGTSLMMQILEAGGLEILTDALRKPDDNNPRGYYEYEKVKSLQKDNSWLGISEGKVVKVIAQLIQYLPTSFSYNVIFMERKIEEVLLSQDKMISSLSGNKSLVSNEILKKTYESQVDRVKTYLMSNQNFSTAFVSYNELIINKLESLTKLRDDLLPELNIENSMKVIDDSLYRNRS